MKVHFLMLAAMVISCQAQHFLIQLASKEEETKKEKGYDYRASISAASSESSSAESSESSALSGSASAAGISSTSGESEKPLPPPEGFEEPNFLSMLDSEELETLQKLENGEEVDSKSKAELDAALKKVEAEQDKVVDGAKGQDYQVFGGHGQWGGWILRRRPLRFGRARGWGRK